ncbi:hypothetical protein KFL_001000330 [Klebsormidium nitens]|uniref:Uncharacterized protein n=1 Tax=Klebsormidium nitens TaxID=105231 RepID=A0A1Y1HYU3_KLENI|nr:hypothetical protein KFL_001000330 [Klebsormidium nitens]|eukprot:GAQ82111.1 hypothetical protein KFL_001000330 [Klebsormidium nitens]
MDESPLKSIKTAVAVVEDYVREAVSRKGRWRLSSLDTHLEQHGLHAFTGGFAKQFAKRTLEKVLQQNPPAPEEEVLVVQRLLFEMEDEKDHARMKRARQRTKKTVHYAGSHFDGCSIQTANGRAAQAAPPQEYEDEGVPWAGPAAAPPLLLPAKRALEEQDCNILMGRFERQGGSPNLGSQSSSPPSWRIKDSIQVNEKREKVHAQYKIPGLQQSFQQEQPFVQTNPLFAPGAGLSTGSPMRLHEKVLHRSRKEMGLRPFWAGTSTLPPTSAEKRRRTGIGKEVRFELPHDSPIKGNAAQDSQDAVWATTRREATDPAHDQTSSPDSPTWTSSRLLQSLSQRLADLPHRSGIGRGRLSSLAEHDGPTDGAGEIEVANDGVEHGKRGVREVYTLSTTERLDKLVIEGRPEKSRWVTEQRTSSTNEQRKIQGFNLGSAGYDLAENDTADVAMAKGSLRSGATTAELPELDGDLQTRSSCNQVSRELAKRASSNPIQADVIQKPFMKQINFEAHTSSPVVDPRTLIATFLATSPDCAVKTGPHDSLIRHAVDASASRTPPPPHRPFTSVLDVGPRWSVPAEEPPDAATTTDESKERASTNTVAASSKDRPTSQTQQATIAPPSIPLGAPPPSRLKLPAPRVTRPPLTGTPAKLRSNPQIPRATAAVPQPGFLAMTKNPSLEGRGRGGGAAAGLPVRGTPVGGPSQDAMKERQISSRVEKSAIATESVQRGQAAQQETSCNMPSTTLEGSRMPGRCGSPATRRVSESRSADLLEWCEDAPGLLEEEEVTW